MARCSFLGEAWGAQEYHAFYSMADRNLNCQNKPMMLGQSLAISSKLIPCMENLWQMLHNRLACKIRQPTAFYSE